MIIHSVELKCKQNELEFLRSKVEKKLCVLAATAKATKPTECKRIQVTVRRGTGRKTEENHPEKSDKIVMNEAKYFCWNLILFSKLLRFSRANEHERVQCNKIEMKMHIIFSQKKCHTSGWRFHIIVEKRAHSDKPKKVQEMLDSWHSRIFMELQWAEALLVHILSCFMQ